MSTQDILNIILILVLVVITTCIVFVSFFFIQALKAVSNLADNLEDATQSIKDKLQLKVLAAIPAVLVSLAARLIRKRRG